MFLACEYKLQPAPGAFECKHLIHSSNNYEFHNANVFQRHYIDLIGLPVPCHVVAMGKRVPEYVIQMIKLHFRYRKAEKLIVTLWLTLSVPEEAIYDQFIFKSTGSISRANMYFMLCVSHLLETYRNVQRLSLKHLLYILLAEISALQSRRFVSN
jgi:hypothetical protein